MIATEILGSLKAEEISFALPEYAEYAGVELREGEWEQVGIGVSKNGTNTGSTENARAHEVQGERIVYYKVMKEGEVGADFDEFRQKVSETLGDERGWVRLPMRFQEVDFGQDLNIIIADPEFLEATAGCSGDLSCTTWNNEVIINDERWREGTEASRAAEMEQRDYQHMVINHEVGHWLGHYVHETQCVDGGPAPVMLQQSTGLRGCDSFNAWPLNGELWTLR